MGETDAGLLGCEGMNRKVARILGAGRPSWKGGLFTAPRSQLEAVPAGKVVDGVGVSEEREGTEVNSPGKSNFGLLWVY